MKVAFFGSGHFAVPSLEAVVASDHEVVLVVTQPPRPAGRSDKPRPTPIGVLAERRGLATLACADVNSEESLALIADSQADVICVAEFGQVMHQAVIDGAPLGSFNLHASVLPALRGAAPINWAIIRGYQRTGVTTFRIVREMDAGPVYLTCETDLRPEETAEDLKARLAALGSQLVCETLDLLAAGDVVPIEQDQSGKTLAPKLTKHDGVIDWDADAVTIRNRIHGTWPWPGGQAVLHRAHGDDVHVVIARAAAEEGPAGTAGVFDDDLRVQTGSGRVGIIEIKPAGKRLMGFSDFVNGYRMVPGDRFLTGSDIHDG